MINGVLYFVKKTGGKKKSMDKFRDIVGCCVAGVWPYICKPKLKKMKVKGGVTIFMLVSNQKKISSLTSAKSCNAGREGQEGTSLCVCNVLSLLLSPAK